MLLDQLVQLVASLIQRLTLGGTLWYREGENACPMVKCDLVDFLEAGEDSIGIETVAKIIRTTKDDNPVILLLGFTLATFAYLFRIPLSYLIRDLDLSNVL